MDEKFRPATAAIRSGDLEGLRSLVTEDPSLATSRSSKSHPTLLQCLTLDAVDVPNKVEMARLLIDAGAEINGPLVAAGSINNVEVAATLLDAGALINGAGGWSPLEEALYWGNNEVIALLLERGASAHNLRTASGLGRIDLIEGFFGSDGSLKPEAGEIAWPFGNPEKLDLPPNIKAELEAKIANWSSDSRSIINNAFVYACMWNHVEAAGLLLQKGADIDAIPSGFDYAGTGLHYAGLRGHRTMVEFLVGQGADANVTDAKGNRSAAGWAEYGGHEELKDYLEQSAKAQAQERAERL